MKLKEILLGAAITILPIQHPDLLNNMGQFPMPDISAFDMVSEKNVKCPNNYSKSIVLRKYVMPKTNRIVAMTASRPRANTYFGIRVTNGKIYIDNGYNDTLAEDGYIDLIFGKDNFPSICKLIPKIYEI